MIVYNNLEINKPIIFDTSVIEYIKEKGLLDEKKINKNIVSINDTINVSCEAYIQNEKNNYFSFEDKNIIAGIIDNNFAYGKTDSSELVGHKVGESVAFAFDVLENDDNFPNAHVSLICDIKSCYGTPDELTLDLVKYLDNSCNSIEEYEEKIKKEIAKRNEEIEQNYIKDNLIQQVIEQSEFDFTDEEINEAISEYISDFNIDIDQYLIDNNISYMEFVNQFKDDALYTKKLSKVIDFIYDNENLEGEDKYNSVKEFLFKKYFIM